MFETMFSKLGEIFKLRPGLAFSLSLACGAIIYFGSEEIIPGIDGVLLTALWVLLFFFGAVALSGVLAAISKLFAWSRHKIAVARFNKKLRNDFLDDVPRLTEREIAILGHLRHYNQKTFTTSQDAGHATTLVAKNYIYSIGVPGQVLHPDHVSFTVHEEVWKQLLKHPEKFPLFRYEHRGRDIEPWVRPIW